MKLKRIIKHDLLFRFLGDESVISIVKHVDVKTGISMYSLNLDDTPVVTCDNYKFLANICEYCEPSVIEDILSDILIDYTLSKCED